MSTRCERSKCSVGGQYDNRRKHLGGKGKHSWEGLSLSPCAPKCPRAQTACQCQHAREGNACHPPNCPKTGAACRQQFCISPAKAMLQTSPRSHPGQLNAEKDEKHKRSARNRCPGLLKDVAASQAMRTPPNRFQAEIRAPDNKDARNNAIGNDAPSKVGHAAGEKCGRKHRQLYGLQPTRRNSTHTNPCKRATQTYEGLCRSLPSHLPPCHGMPHAARKAGAQDAFRQEAGNRCMRKIHGILPSTQHHGGMVYEHMYVSWHRVVPKPSQIPVFPPTFPA